MDSQESKRKFSKNLGARWKHLWSGFNARAPGEGKNRAGGSDLSRTTSFSSLVRPSISSRRRKRTLVKPVADAPVTHEPQPSEMDNASLRPSTTSTSTDTHDALPSSRWRKLRMPGAHFDEPSTPGQFPEGESRMNARDILMASLKLPALLGLDTSFKSGASFFGLAQEKGTETEESATPEFPTRAPGDPGIDTDHEPEGLEDRSDYFAYPSRVAWDKRKSYPSAMKSSPEQFHGSPRSVPRRVDDDTWSMTDDTEGAPAHKKTELHPSAPRSEALSKTLHELDEVEISEFLNHFSRHTREVHLPSATRHFTRMPQWSDFAYSSEEDEESIQPFAPSESLADRHRRSRLLMHVDRGLHRLEVPEVSEVNLVPSAVSTPGDSSLSRRQSSDVELPRSNSLSAMSNLAKMKGPSEMITPAMLPGSPEPLLDSPIDGRPQKHLRIADDATEIPPELHDDHVDGVAFCVAYILALVEQYAPDDLDEAPVTEYRESRARSHVERLYIIAPFWEQLAANLRTLYCWEVPRRTAAAAMIYFVLWYTDMLPSAFFLTLLYYVLQFRYFPQDESLLHQRVHERMVRGQHANRMAERLKRRSRLDILDLYKRWAGTYGVVSQVAAGDVADFHEKIKNLLLWRNPRASRRTAFILLLISVLVTIMSPALVFKTFLFFCGITFFALMPLQTLYPRYRRALNPLWWAVLGAPTDAQWAIQLLRKRHMRYQEWLHDIQHRGLGGGTTSNGYTSGSDAPPPPLTVADERLAQMAAETAPSKHPKVTADMDRRKLDTFLCQHYGVPGHLVVTPSHFYFRSLRVMGAGSKHYVTRLEDIMGLRKTHGNRFWLWDSHGMKIMRRGRNTLLLANMARRDEAFNLLLTLASHQLQDL